MLLFGVGFIEWSESEMSKKFEEFYEKLCELDVGVIARGTSKMKVMVMKFTKLLFI
jgi:hypothetical protein